MMRAKTKIWGKLTMTKLNNAQKVLETAKNIICGERQDTYGNPEDSFATIAEYWNIYLNSSNFPRDFKLTSADVAHMMTLLKMARITGQKFHMDNYVDMAGYTALAAEILAPTTVKLCMVVEDDGATD